MFWWMPRVKGDLAHGRACCGRRAIDSRHGKVLRFTSRAHTRPRIDGTRRAATRAMHTMASSFDELQILGTAEAPGTETAQFRRDRMTSLTQTYSINTCGFSPDDVLGEKDDSKQNADGADREVGASQEVLHIHDTPAQHDQHQNKRAHVLAANPACRTEYDALPASKHFDREAAVDSDLIPFNAQVRGGGGDTRQNSRSSLQLGVDASVQLPASTRTKRQLARVTGATEERT